MNMEEVEGRQLGQAQTKIRNVPIAVTPEGFWCCPSPAALQKSLKNQNHQSKQKVESLQKEPIPPVIKKSNSTTLRSQVASEDQKCVNSTSSDAANAENQQSKISVGYGQPETSDLKVILHGKEGIAVKMSVHRDVLAEHSSFFADKLSRQTLVPCIEIAECEDVEIYVETVGLMYCKEVKYRLIKQSVPRVLRILKAADSLGFPACINSCLNYLEAVPWVGEEEENVISSIRHLHRKNYGVSPVLKRVATKMPSPPTDTLCHIMQLVLRSKDDKSRRDMKTLVLKLLKENNQWTHGSVDISVETLYSSCSSCLGSLLDLFKQASHPDFSDKPLEDKDSVVRQIALESDNLLWLVEILTIRHVADEFTLIWANQNELAGLHSKLPIVSRHLVSCITARLFVGIGKGEMLPSKETRQMLLQVWLQPLIDDYSWLQHGCRSFNRNDVEEGIGRTILTLPLDDQRSILLSWLGSFLKIGDNCPNLQRAFEVWWRRTFIRPYVVEQPGSNLQLDKK